MASSSKKILINEKNLECSFCCEIYKDPCCLPSCGHSFCGECLIRMTQKVRRIPCPVCRTVADIPPNGLPINYGLKGAADTARKLRKITVKSVEEFHEKVSKICKGLSEKLQKWNKISELVNVMVAKSFEMTETAQSMDVYDCEQTMKDMGKMSEIVTYIATDFDQLNETRLLFILQNHRDNVLIRNTSQFASLASDCSLEEEQIGTAAASQANATEQPNQWYDVEAPSPSQPTVTPLATENMQSPMGVSGQGNVQPIVLNGDKDVFIGGLPLPSVTDLHHFQKLEQEVRDFLETHHGKVQSVRCPVRRQAQKAAFAFVSFETNEGVESFIRSIMPNTKNNVELDLNYTGTSGPVIAYVDKIKSPVPPGKGGRFQQQAMGRPGPDRPCTTDMGDPRGGGGYQNGNKPGGEPAIGPRGMQRTSRRDGGRMLGGRGGGRGMPGH